MNELIEERVVVERFGISAEDCLWVRKGLERGTHWDVQKEKGVVWSQAGVKELAAVLDVPVPDFGKKEGGPVLLAAVRVDFPNRQIILAEAGGRKVRCRVKDAAMYVPCMRFEARRVCDDLYEALRAPRARGMV